jgi:carboxypeptidase C (cathepsin A)
MGFLANLVKVFPSLAKRPLHLIGESYAGVYIVRHVLSLIRIHLILSLVAAVYNKGLFRTPESAR